MRATPIIPKVAAADDPDIASIIQYAETLFIEGGDQSDYIDFWQGTLPSLHRFIQRRGLHRFGRHELCRRLRQRERAEST